jgi:hypothetical protein
MSAVLAMIKLVLTRWLKDNLPRPGSDLPGRGKIKANYAGGKEKIQPVVLGNLL